ncbi:vomeronasal type-2 receptor 26-like [Pseudophryne corroboree]|uniref:vomeronasal type-2 receptor 26-like n=1 Tax=Pseudophryne corroboree TaxID=495146 RepID=UPI003081AAFE
MPESLVKWLSDFCCTSSAEKYFLRRGCFKDPTGEEIYFNEKGEMTTKYYIYNYAVISDRIYRFRKVGIFDVTSPENEPLFFSRVPVIWKHGQHKIQNKREPNFWVVIFLATKEALVKCLSTQVPVSICSQDCPLGFRRVSKRGIHQCCFECVQCSEGEISNDTDKASCQKCPEDHWPNDKYQCVPKPVEFLSYNYNPTALIISIVSILLFIKTIIILIIFILFRDTPIIKANNQHLSFLLLVSIMMSFLCVLLFLGRPAHITCMLRQTSFGIIFSVAISCILAKTIMVYLAFNATKPGSSWRKLIGVKFTNCVVFICSFTQVVISIIWLCVSPPFPECNSYTYLDKIIIQCNEGSILAFSILLGYMGLLAAVSFIAAFLARNLPDSFNEAKYITFSMLVFCCVWVTFIPAYMSVTGKSTVLVEIFAIISSNIGILGCIFYPKCYIILVRPELNSKRILLGKNKLQSFD